MLIRLINIATLPLRFAADNSQTEVVKAFLEYGANYSKLSNKLDLRAEIAKINQTKKVFADDSSILATEINKNYLRYLSDQSSIPHRSFVLNDLT